MAYPMPGNDGDNDRLTNWAGSVDTVQLVVNALDRKVGENGGNGGPFPDHSDFHSGFEHDAEDG